MFIHESPLLLPGLLTAQPEDKPIDPSPWRVNEEVLVREAGENSSSARTAARSGFA